jgi:hypothetical protein
LPFLFNRPLLHIRYSEGAAFKAHIDQTGTPYVATNLDLDGGDVLGGSISKSVVLTTAAGKKVAVLSLMDPEFGALAFSLHFVCFRKLLDAVNLSDT